MSKFLESAKIDTHCHYVTTSYVAAMDKFLGGNPDRFPMPEWSPEKQLEFMDQMGIVHSVISYSSPHVNFSNPEVNADLVRVGNEEGAECVRKHPGKFSVLASLPVPDVDRSLGEIAYCCDKLGVDGFTLPTNTKGVYMGAKELEPVFAELDRRGALVTFHPNKPGAVPSGVGEKLPIPMMEFFFDTTRCVVDLMMKGYVGRYANIKFLIPHCGALLAYVVDRIDSFKPVLVRIGSAADDFDVRSIFSKLYFDIAGNAGPHQLRDILDMVDESHLMYASDYPFTPTPVIVQQGTTLFNSPYLNEEQKTSFANKNALALFPKAVPLFAKAA